MMASVVYRALLPLRVKVMRGKGPTGCTISGVSDTRTSILQLKARFSVDAAPRIALCGLISSQ